jgi:predicted nucleic acid-binding protein
MSAEKAIYLDSSAIVKLVVEEAESRALRLHLRRQETYVSSALARTEVGRSLLRLGPTFMARGEEVLRRLDLVHISERILRAAAGVRPPELCSLDAIHLATASELGTDLGSVVTYDERMASAARVLGFVVVAPA